MMGIAFSRLSQFMRQNQATIEVIGYEQLADVEEVPPLIADGSFEPGLFRDKTLASRMHVTQLADIGATLEQAKERMSNGLVDAVIYFPSGFADRLTTLRNATHNNGDADIHLPANPPDPIVFHDVRDESQLANSRVQAVLDRWQASIVRSNLAASRLPIDITNPFAVRGENIAPAEGRRTAFWAKLLPFIVFICALTGAFYPAVDLCAGEKERGTLETLLTSPAQRSEIVGGKLLTVATFSIGSALCNLASMAITGHLIIKQLNAMSVPGQEALAPPSMASIAWLLVALVPMSAFFSAASLALASLARSTKEGQYYLMPLFLVCMPLMMLPLMPGVELSLATSLVPISGMVLLMQAAMAGKLALVAIYALPVLVVTFGCCAVAGRWAIDQFNQESVLFRDTENFDIATWARYAFTHRPDTPRLATAAILISLIFITQFFSQGIGFDITKASGFVKLVLFSQLVCILLPTLLMAIVSVRSYAKTFLMDRSIPWKQVVVGCLLALALHPVGTAFMEGLVKVIPLDPSVYALAKQLESSGGTWELPLGVVLLLMAVLPAICEELAFRGFVLTGLPESAFPGLGGSFVGHFLRAGTRKCFAANDFRHVAGARTGVHRRKNIADYALYSLPYELQRIAHAADDVR